MTVNDVLNNVNDEALKSGAYKCISKDYDFQSKSKEDFKKWEQELGIKHNEFKDDEIITETSIHHLICAMCDNDKCVRGTKECEFEQWKEKEERDDNV